MITGSLVTFGVTMLAAHFGCSWAVPFVLRGIGIARGAAGVAGGLGSLVKPSAPRPDATVGQMVLTDPKDIAYVEEMRRRTAGNQSLREKPPVP